MGLNGVDGMQSGGRSLIDLDGQLAELGGDVNARVAAMVLGQSRESRAAAEEARHTEEQHLQSQEAAQVAALHEQADAIRAAGTALLASGLIGGALQMASGAVSLGANADSSGGELALIGGKAKIIGAGGDAVNAGGKFVSSNFEGAQTDATADGREAEQAAAASKRRLDDLQTLHSDARELMRTALDFLRESSRAKGEVDRAPLSIRG